MARRTRRKRGRAITSILASPGEVPLANGAAEVANRFVSPSERSSAEAALNCLMRAAVGDRQRSHSLDSGTRDRAAPLESAGFPWEARNGRRPTDGAEGEEKEALASVSPKAESKSQKKKKKRRFRGSTSSISALGVPTEVLTSDGKEGCFGYKELVQVLKKSTKRTKLGDREGGKKSTKKRKTTASNDKAKDGEKRRNATVDGKAPALSMSKDESKAAVEGMSPPMAKAPAFSSNRDASAEQATGPKSVDNAEKVSKSCQDGPSEKNGDLAVESSEPPNNVAKSDERDEQAWLVEIKLRQESPVGSAANDHQSEGSEVTLSDPVETISTTKIAEQLTPTQMDAGERVSGWTCDVCQEATFDDYDDAVAHEKACLGGESLSFVHEQEEATADLPSDVDGCLVKDEAKAGDPGTNTGGDDDRVIPRGDQNLSLASAAAVPVAPAIQPSTNPLRDRHEKKCEAEHMNSRTNAEQIDQCPEPTVAAVTPAKPLPREGDDDRSSNASGVAEPPACEHADAYQEPTVADVTPAKHLPREGDHDRFSSTSGVAEPAPEGTTALMVDDTGKRASPVAREHADAHQEPTLAAVTPAKHPPSEGDDDSFGSTSGIAAPPRKGKVGAVEKRASPVALEDVAASKADARLTSTEATLLPRTSPASPTPAAASIARPGKETLGVDSPPPATNCESSTGNVDPSLAALAKESALVIPPLPPETAVSSGVSSSASFESAASATSDDIATSRSTNANEEQDPKMGPGSSIAVDVRGDITTEDTSSNGSPSANEESDIVAVNTQVKEAAKQALALSGKVPAPDWRICSTHDKRRRRDLWVLPCSKIQFDTRKDAFEFEEFRKILSDGPSALAAYKEMKRRLGEKPRVRALTCDLSNEEADVCSEEGAQGDPDQVAEGDPENSDECYVCEDGGELVCCDFCPKAFHTNCHIPRLHLESLPPGAWKCMECLASSFKRKQRCGVCRECKRPDCGKCCCCRRKKSFGGDGKYGKPCKLKRCKNMRFASTEKPKAKSKSKMSTSAKVSTKRKPTGDQAIVVSKKPRLDHMASTMVQLAKGTLATPKKPSPGKGWVYKLATIAGDAQQRYVWLSPARKIPFKRRPAASIFEELRTKFGGDEIRAWEKYRMMRKGKDAHVLAPARYDNAPTQLVSPQPIKPTKEPPGPGWVHKLGSNGKCRPVSHWISPIRKIEFKRWKQALKFEQLREKFGADEVQAWKEYRKMTKSLGDARVVSPGQYDDIYSTSHERPNSKEQEVATTASAVRKSKQPQKQSPGKGWTCKRVLEASNPWPICYWSSPERGIEFKRHAQAAEFEALRKEYDGNEYDAWEHYRKMKRGGNVCVVGARQYDASCPKDHTSTKRSFEYVGSEADAKPKRQKKQKGTTQGDKKLAGLSSGWKTTQRIRTHYMTPKLNLEFRSHASAADFDSKSLKKYPRDEAKALDAYIKEVGRERFRALVANFGRYRPRWKDGSNNTETESKRSAVVKKKDMAGPESKVKVKEEVFDYDTE